MVCVLNESYFSKIMQWAGYFMLYYHLNRPDGSCQVSSMVVFFFMIFYLGYSFILFGNSFLSSCTDLG